MPNRQDICAYQGATYEDSVELKNKNGDTVHLASGDMLIFGIRPHYSDACIIEKTMTLSDEAEGVYPIHLTPEEMDIEPDEYKYDVGLQTAGGDFYKVISESSFTVLSSTTKKRVSEGE